LNKHPAGLGVVFVGVYALPQPTRLQPTSREGAGMACPYRQGNRKKLFFNGLYSVSEGFNGVVRRIVMEL